jgi:ribonuclease-3
VTQPELAARAQQVLGYCFKNPDLLQTALTHSSIANSRVQSNERLEFLGDSVLGVVICEELYRRFGEWLEGDLTKVKSVVVSRRVCAEIADQIQLSEILILGNGIDARTSIPTSLRAAVIEAVIGAIYLDGGLDPARRFILAAFDRHLDKASRSDNHENYKSALQQYAQRYLSATPQYLALDEQGPDHSKCFEVCVTIGPQRYPSAWGTSKKEAEQEAAKRALEILQTQHRLRSTG